LSVNNKNEHPQLWRRIVLAAQIRGARGVLGWKQSELAERTGMSTPSVNRLERAEHEPRYTTVAVVKQILALEGVLFSEEPDGGFSLRISGELVGRLVDKYVRDS
jgi:transcriptional regulator with XRE-family HTH domain